MNEKKTIENEFGKFFYLPHYIALKNYLFNYRMRKNMVQSAFFNYFGRNFKKEFIIADIGPGVSPVSPVLNKTLFVELEDKAIELMKKEKLNVIKGDITKLPLKNNSINAIVCSEVLEHVPDYESGLKEIARVLKTKGAAIITVPIHQKYWKDDDDFVGHLRRFNPSTLHKDIESAGLKVVIRKPIGSLLERWLTWIMIRVARTKDISEMKDSGVSFMVYRLTNEFLFQLIRVSNLINSENNSSIIMFVAAKN